MYLEVNVIETKQIYLILFIANSILKKTVLGLNENYYIGSIIDFFSHEKQVLLSVLSIASPSVCVCVSVPRQNCYLFFLIY